MKHMGKNSRIFLMVFFVIFNVTCQKEDFKKENRVITDVTSQTSIDSQQLKSAVVPTYLLNLIGTINSMTDHGVLNKVYGVSLISRINNAIMSKVKGNNNVCGVLLNAFIKEVEALIKIGVINSNDGELLIKAAKFVIYFPDGNFTDPRDGRRYSVVLIKNQIWMAEDLKATKYNDRKDIPTIVGNSDWIALTTGAYCWYDNDVSYKKTYGGLYNWYAVNTGKLSPIGWHVPSNAEWVTLIDNLGGEAIAGGKLKEAGYRHWLAPNAGATNESGFTALPSGDRIGALGEFYNLLGYGIYWSTDEVSPTYAINRVLVFDDTNFRIGYDNKTAGFSVRCIKD